MKRNEKLLAGGLALLVVGYFGWPTIRGIYITPVEEARGRVALLEEQVGDQRYQQVQLQVAAKQLTDWRNVSLPGDELDAQRLYQQWLTDLAITSGLDVKVTPQRRDRVNGVYTAVKVLLEGQATFKELQTFLRRFHSVDLLHRVVRIDADSPAADGDPQLKFSLIAEGLNLDGNRDRDRIFPQVKLAEALPAAASELTLPAKTFAAKPGDLLRIGTEFAAISDIDGDRVEVARAADGTAAADHPSGTDVELFPLRRTSGKGGSTTAQLAAAVESPFVKPRKYEPRFDGFADQKLVRGNTATMKVKVADYDVTAGSPKVELAAAPDGLSFDAETGEITWTPSADLPVGNYKVTLAADLPSPKKRLERTVTITVVDPNVPPVLEPVSVSDVFLGETLRVPLKATDSGPVTYKLDQGPPGATVDASTGELTWAIPTSFTPGDVTVTVSAADSGEPPQSAQQTFTIKVHENLKPFVRMVGVGADPEPWAWLYDQSSNRKMTLREGQTFKAAGVEATVREIGPDFVTYDRDGATWRIALGQHLDQVERIAGAPVAEVSVEKPAEAEKPAKAGPSPGPPAAAATDRPSAS